MPPSRTVYVYRPQSIIKAFEDYYAELANNSPTAENPLQITVRKSRTQQQCSYVSVTIKAIPIGSNFAVRAPFIMKMGSLTEHLPEEVIYVSTDSIDPNNSDNKTSKSYGPSMTTTIADSGILGELYDKYLSVEWEKQIKKIVETPGTDFSDSTVPINPLVKRINSNKPSVPLEHRGKPKANPVIRFKIDFTKFSDKHPMENLRGEQKTQLFDLSKGIQQDNGTVHYPLAESIRGTPIDNSTMYEIVKRGSAIEQVYIIADSGSMSSTYISWQHMLLKTWIRPPSEVGFSDEVTASAPLFTPKKEQDEVEDGAAVKQEEVGEEVGNEDVEDEDDVEDDDI